MAELPAGSRCAGYLIETLLGRGGMGAVYRARALDGGQPVALKLIAAELADDPKFRERFRREALAAASLEHPHVVPILDANEHDGTLYLAMRLIEGVDLGTLIEREGLLAPELAVRLVAQVASALDAAHAIGLVHRDVKPANLLVAETGAGPHVYLTDFGIARRLQDTTRLTRPGMAVGTLNYLAPEALRGEGAGPALDIYALGCVLYEALAGEVPFAADNDVSVIFAHLEAPPPPLATRAPGIPPALEYAVHRAMAKDPGERFASPNAFARAARAALEAAAADLPAPSGATSGPAAQAATAALPVTPEPRAPADTTPTRKRVTVLYTVSGIEAGLDPELRLAAAADFERLAQPILERHGATVEASPTEGIIAVFGLPTLHEDDAARAVRAALELRLQGSSAGRASVATTAIATDVVLAGGGTPQAASLRGLLDQALRMCQAAGPGEVVVSDATREFAASSARFEAFAEGSAAPSGPWRALPPEAGIAAEPRPARLVGRGRELASLREALRCVSEGRTSRLVSIVGEPGVGKSRLASEFAAMIGSEATVAVARCLPRGESEARQPVRDLLAQLVLGEPSADPRELLDGDDAEAIAERVERLLGVREGPVPADELPWVVRRYLSAVARERPLVALFDDIHWAEPVLLELIEHVAEWTPESPLLLACMTRPELLDERPDWGAGAKDALRLLLVPLSDRDSAALIDALEDTVDLTEAVRSQIVAAAEGNPLFVEQMVALVRERPEYGDAITVPPNIQALLAARLDQLGEEEHQAVSHAAVIGREFSHEGLDHLLAESAPAAVIRSLVRRELVEPVAARDAFRFRHALIRDAAYETLPKTVRADLHEHHADWLESARAGPASDEAIGYQLEQSYRNREELGALDDAGRALAARAAERLGAAGHAAYGRGEMATAAGLLERARALHPPGSPAALSLLYDLSTAMTMSGSASEALRLLEEAEPSETEPGMATHLAVARQFTATMVDPGVSLDEAIRTSERAIELFESERDLTGLARAWTLAAFAQVCQAQHGPATVALEKALELARGAGDPWEEARVIGFLCMCLSAGPAPAPRAIARCEELMEMVEGRPGYVMGVADLAWLHAMTGAFGEARRRLRRCVELADERGLALGRAAIAVTAGEVELLAGDPGAAERELRPQWELLADADERGDRAYLAATLARALEAQGRHDEAERLTEAAEEAAFDEDVLVQADWRATRARLVARRGDLAQGEALAGEAVALLAKTDALNARGDCALALAEVSARADNRQQAVGAARDAAAEYAAKENVVSLRRAEGLLRELTLA